MQMRQNKFPKTLAILSLVILIPAGNSFAADGEAALRLAPHIDALMKVVKGKTDVFTVQLDAQLPGGMKKLNVKLGRAGDRQFFASIEGPSEIQSTLVLTPDRLFIDMPLKNTAFVADGALPEGAEALKPHELFMALFKLSPMAEHAWPILENGDGRSISAAIDPLIHAEFAEQEKPESNCDYLKLKPGDGKTMFNLALSAGKPAHLNAAWKDDKQAENGVALSLSETCVLPELPAGRTIIPVKRAEFERALQCGALRLIDIKADDFNSEKPGDLVKEIPGARLEIRNGQRTCWLTGSPYEMGLRHGKLLAPEVRKVTDSTLYVVGFYYSISKGKWFLDEIRNAWSRLQPHCDKEYLDELKGLAEGAGIPEEEMKLANVFPELFHCSGFAISGDATVGGKLYHGRVLDYMTDIGLQHVQVDFITKKDGRHGYVNVGYAGFLGCVTGMNDAQIGLGEMGGRGEGNWDGTPMAFLMRMVLERAETLEQAQDIFKNAKRTCEYYYVISDGKTRSAVGVAAWPEKIEFLKQGEPNPRLPDAVPGCVLISADQRYKLLAKRTKDAFGKLDEAGAIDLMQRPVAMGSNLHAVLFVPEDQVYHVAHASYKGHQAAATQPYVRHDLKAELKTLEAIGTVGAGR